MSCSQKEGLASPCWHHVAGPPDVVTLIVLRLLDPSDNGEGSTLDDYFNVRLVGRHWCRACDSPAPTSVLRRRFGSFAKWEVETGRRILDGNVVDALRVWSTLRASPETMGNFDPLMTYDGVLVVLDVAERIVDSCLRRAWPTRGAFYQVQRPKATYLPSRWSKSPLSMPSNGAAVDGALCVAHFSAPLM